METSEQLITLYVLLVVATVILAALKKTSWWSLLGVIVIPIYFLFVVWDAATSGAKEEPKAPEDKPQDPVGRT